MPPVWQAQMARPLPIKATERTRYYNTNGKQKASGYSSGLSADP